MRNWTSALFLLLTPLFLTAQELDLKEIMKGKDFIGYWPENHAWHVNGQSILFDWQQVGELADKRHAYDIAKKKTRVLGPQNRFDYITYDYDQRQFDDQYFSSNGDLGRYNKKTFEFTMLVQTSKYIWDIQRLNKASEVVYRQGNNLYKYDLNSGSITQITNFLLKNEIPEAPKTQLHEQQEELFQYIRDEQAIDSVREARRHDFHPPKIYLGKVRIDFIKIDPTGRYVVLSTSKASNNKGTSVTHHVTEDGYTYEQKARAKVGHQDPQHQLYIWEIGSEELMEITADELSDIRQKPSFRIEYGDSGLYENNRKVIYHAPKFNFNGDFVMDVRAYDNKDRWIVHWTSGDSTFKELERQHDEAWIGGPGISNWNMVPGVLGWLPDNQRIYYQSEETGYSHLYLRHVITNQSVQLTEGKFEIHEVQLSNNGEYFYVHANKEHPGKLGLYTVDVAKGNMKKLIEEDGAVKAMIHPNEQDMALLISSSNKPWELHHRNLETKFARKITRSISPAFEAYEWRQPTVTTFKGMDGEDVYTRVYEPAPKKRNGAAVIFVHGAGYLQNAHYWWSNYYREYMFHNLLTDLGYTVLDIDYRASAGYGRDYRTAIYRHMGGWDLNDQLSGRQYLIDKHGIDSTRIGIYGGSYGGFMTLMALLTKPDAFACGAALRSVTDWEHYNHEYTSNILNNPQDDPEAYRKSSPIYFAENLSKPLVMLHGMVDDNVQFQDVVRLSQRFIELGKEDWELAVFPVEAHGFQKSYSWYDEYRRILEIMNENLLGK